MVLVDQWVDESGGLVVVVSLMISAILSSPWVLGVPDLGASESVCTPNNENRLLHLSTVCAESESVLAIALVPIPSSANKAILARRT
jgi:hypothetical protein